MSTRGTNQRGSALLTVLWISAALSAIAFSVSTTVRSETDRVSTASDGLRTWYLATGSVERGIQWLLWGNAYRNPDGTPRFYEWNKTPRMNMSFPSGDAIVELIPEAAKLNINTASPDDLMRIVSVVAGDLGRAQQVVDGIVDWRGGRYPSQLRFSFTPPLLRLFGLATRLFRRSRNYCWCAA